MQQLYERVCSDEVAQAVGGTLPVTGGSDAGQALRISRHLLGQWISIAYMSFAQVVNTCIALCIAYLSSANALAYMFR